MHGWPDFNWSIVTFRRCLLTKDEKQIVAICDLDEDYLSSICEYLQSTRDIPWIIKGYTDLEKIANDGLRQNIALLLISESLFSEKVDDVNKNVIILNESGLLKWPLVKNIDKYRSADLIYVDILEYFAEISDKSYPRLSINTRTKFIGIYSPVRRCLQTGFAISMAQILSLEHKTLYINFEHYSGIMDILPDVQTRDLADLMYFLNTENEKFRLRLKTIIHRQGNLEYIPPMKVGQNLLSIPKEEWLSLMAKIAGDGEYEYVIMDLTESMQGLFEILRNCLRVYTIVMDDDWAECKLNQYEQLLMLTKYDDVLSKTTKCHIPKIKRLPAGIEQYAHGDLAEYVRIQLKDILEMKKE